jgi:hypothetical protein
MQALFKVLVAELERPRPLSPQVIRHLTDHFGLEREALGPFLDTQLPRLAEDELDLLLSPLFTPKLADQAIFAATLHTRSVPATDWPALIDRLATRPTVGHLVTETGSTHSFTLQAVTLTRFVTRLRLDGSLDASLFELIQALYAPADRPLLWALARRAIWNTAARQEVLRRQLANAPDPFSAVADAIELLKVMETTEPADAAEILARLPAWEEILRGQIAEAGQPKIFFNEQVRYMHGGGRDQRPLATRQQTAKEEELAFLGRLRHTLAA